MDNSKKIAVVGMSCRFAGVEGVDEFWEAISQGMDMITEIPASRFDYTHHFSATRTDPNTLSTSVGGFLKHGEDFDPRFFKMSPREAAETDPQQRVVLEVAYEALDSAGYVADKTPAMMRKSFGAYVGVTNCDYAANSHSGIGPYYTTGTGKSFVSTRISHAFGWSGPSITVDTAGSSGLVAIHQACQAIIHGDCKAAVAGGVNMITSPHMYVGLSRASMLSATGGSKPFDAAADGYCRGEGCGIVVLKRLSDAIADRDNIIGVLTGSAVNQSGPASSITSPHAETQKDLLDTVMAKAGVRTQHVTYVEAHGGATQTGDAAEMAALQQVFGVNRMHDNPLYVASVKPNVGHAESASGPASFIKVLLMMQHRAIPPHIHLHNLNPEIDHLKTFNMVIPKKLTPWVSSTSRTAVVNNYGVGGSNCSVVIESFDNTQQRQQDSCGPAVHVLTLSAKSTTSLQNLRSRYCKFLKSARQDISDIAYTASARRNHYGYRLAVTGSSPDALLAALEAPNCDTAAFRNQPRKIVFVFPDQECFYLNMCKELYTTFSTFRNAFNECDALIQKEQGCSIHDVVFACHSPSLSLQDTQLAVFAVQYGLAKMWSSMGVRPEFVLGHGLGEYVAAVVAGCITVKSAVHLIIARCSLLERMHYHKHMLTISDSASHVKTLIHSAFPNICSSTVPEIACQNSPEDVVVAGETAHLRVLEEKCKTRGIATKWSDVAFPFNSRFVEPMLDEFRCVAAKIEYRAPTIAFMSNVTGGRVATLDADYFCDQMRKVVRFEQAVDSILDANAEQPPVFIEMGPSGFLPMIKKIAAARGSPFTEQQALATVRRQGSDWAHFTGALKHLYLQGVDLDWDALYVDRVQRKVVNLPSYAFDRVRCWIDFKDVPFQHSACLLFEKAQAGKLAAEHASIQLTRTTIQHLPDLFDLLHRVVQMPAHANGHVAIFDLPTLAIAKYIDGHRLEDFAVCPASVYCELAMASACAIDKANFDTAFAVRDLELIHPLVRHKYSAITIRIEMEQRNAAYAFCVTSYSDANPSVFVKHAEGVVELQAVGIVRKQIERDVKENDIRGQLNRMQISADADIIRRSEIYRVFDRVLAYTPMYQGLKRVELSASGQKGSARISVDLPLSAGSEKYVVHPVLQDTFLQGAIFLANGHSSCPKTEVRFLNGIKEVMFLQGGMDPTAEYYAFFMLEDKSAREKVAKIYIFDLNENLVAVMSGISFRCLQRSVLTTLLSSSLAMHTSAVKEMPKEIPRSVMDSLRFPSPPATPQLSPSPLRSRTVSIANDSRSWSATQSAMASVSVTPTKGQSPVSSRQSVSSSGISQRSTVTISLLKTIIAESLGVDSTELKDDDNLVDWGLDPLMTIEIQSKLRKLVSCELGTSAFTDYPTISGLLAHLNGHAKTTVSSATASTRSVKTAAPMACRTSYSSTAPTVKSIVADALGMSVAHLLQQDCALAELGMDAVMLIEIREAILKRLHVDIGLSFFVDNPTLHALCRHVDERLGFCEVAVEATRNVFQTHDRNHVHRIPAARKPRINAAPHHHITSTMVSRYIPDIHHAMDKVSAKFSKFAEETGFAGYCDTVEVLQDQLFIRYVTDAFAKLGCDLPHMRHGASVGHLHNVLPEHSRLMGRLWWALAEVGVVKFDEDRNEYVRSHLDLSGIPQSDELLDTLLDRYPEYSQDTRLMAKTGSVFADCLTGKVNSREIFFDDFETSHLMHSLYTGSPMFATTMKQLNDLLPALFRVFDTEAARRPVRILEVGGGVGGAAQMMIPTLAKLGRKVEYTFTDVSRSWFAKAQKTLDMYDFVDCKVFDCDQDPEEQGIAIESFDIVIAVNGVHAAQNLNRAVGNISKLLTCNGVLILSELIQAPFWLDLVFGLQRKWWNFDTDERNYPLISTDAWRGVFASSGLTQFAYTRGVSAESNIQKLLCGRKTAIPGKVHTIIHSIDPTIKDVIDTSDEELMHVLRREISLVFGSLSLPLSGKHTIAEFSSIIEQHLLDEAALVRSDHFITTHHWHPATDRSHDVPARTARFPLLNLCQTYLDGIHLPKGAIRSHTYHEKMIPHHIDVSKLEDAMNALIERHPMLKAKISADGQYFVDQSAGPYRIRKQHMHGKSEFEVKRVLEEIREDRKSAGGGEDGWLFFLAVVEVAHNETILVFDADSLLMDSQSMLLLSRQLAIGYYEGPYAIPSGPDFSYAEYTRIIAARQADSDIARKERAYWFSRLDTLPGPLRLPHKNGATMTVQHPGFRNQLHRIDSARWAAVRHQITSRGLEPSTVLMVVFAEMLSMQSGQNHFCFNVKFQDRVRGIHDEVDDIVGNFDAAMLAEMDFRDGGEMLVQRARRVQKMVLEDLAHSSLVTATQVTAELNKRRDTPHKTYSPVTFESKFPLVRKLKKMDSQDRMFLFEPLVEENVTYHNHATAGMELDHQVAEDDAGRLVMNFDFIRNVFPQDSITDMTAWYIETIRSLGDSEAWSKPSMARMKSNVPASMSCETQGRTTCSTRAGCWCQKQ